MLAHNFNLTPSYSCLVIQHCNLKKKKCKKLSLSSWNVHAHQDSDSVAEQQQKKKTALVSLELKKYSIDIAALSKTCFAGSSPLEEVEGRYVFFWSGKRTNEVRQSYFGFAIQSFQKGLSNHIMTLTLDLNHDKSTTLISCYTPTMNRSV